MSSPSKVDGVYLIINNIPKTFHSSNLRNFFSSFVESGGFVCFHYRHRPEVQKPSKSDTDQSRRVTNCCIIKVVPERVEEFIKQYNGEHWLDKNGETLPTCCFIKRISFSDAGDSSQSEESRAYKQGTVNTHLPIDKETFSQKDVDSLIELHPPSVMPNGNVGTRTSHFLQAIQACRLPPQLISKLDLQFPRNRSRRIYGSVPFEYKVKQRNQAPVLSDPVANEKRQKTYWSRKPVQEPNQEKSDAEESEEEEWDRHEALHDDVSGQERNKERLFEEKIELKWEKGGSGLVFYTDAQYWDAKEGDFDAKTSDDWDIDTRVYTQSGPDADKDMQDLIKLRQESRLRGEEVLEPDKRYEFAAFEKYNKGIGRRLLESQGWKQGQGIGRNAAGIAEPLPNDGQAPQDKKGFGYRGEKLQRHPKCERRKRKQNEFDESEAFRIHTVYDDIYQSSHTDSDVISSSFSKIKYNKKFFKEQN